MQNNWRSGRLGTLRALALYAPKRRSVIITSWGHSDGWPLSEDAQINKYSAGLITPSLLGAAEKTRVPTTPLSYLVIAVDKKNPTSRATTAMLATFTIDIRNCRWASSGSIAVLKCNEIVTSLT